VFMERNIHEILDSQQHMLDRLQSDQAQRDPRADPAKAYLQQVKAARAWLGRHGIPAIAVDYNALIEDPHAQVQALAEFLGRTDSAQAMTAAVDPELYRSRRQPAEACEAVVQ